MDYSQYLELPKTPQINNVPMENDGIRWYWKALAILSSWFLLAGYLIFPIALERDDEEPRVSMTTLIVCAAVMITVGYMVSVMLCFSQHAHFLLQSVFLPCFGSSLMGLFNVVFNIFCRNLLPLKSLAVVVIVVSTSSTVIYAIVSLYTYSRILSRRMRQHQSSYPDDGTALLTEDEMQRRQLLKLLQNRDSDRAPTPELVQGTFRIDLPETVNPGRGRDRYPSMPGMPESAYERRTVVISPPPVSTEYGQWEASRHSSADSSPHVREVNARRT